MLIIYISLHKILIYLNNASKIVLLVYQQTNNLLSVSLFLIIAGHSASIASLKVVTRTFTQHSVSY